MPATNGNRTSRNKATTAMTAASIAIQNRIGLVKLMMRPSDPRTPTNNSRLMLNQFRLSAEFLSASSGAILMRGQISVAWNVETSFSPRRQMEEKNNQVDCSAGFALAVATSAQAVTCSSLALMLPLDGEPIVCDARKMVRWPPRRQPQPTEEVALIARATRWLEPQAPERRRPDRCAMLRCARQP